MTLEEMREAAIAQVSLHAEVDCTPVISGEIFDIVGRCRRASVFTVSTAYFYGDVVQLATRNGHRYRCVQGGTSSATEPTFPTGEYSSLTDGTASWREDGPDYENVYDVRAAIHEAWMVKAVRSSHLVTTSVGNSRIEASALQAQCRERARDYAPVGFA